MIRIALMLSLALVACKKKDAAPADQPGTSSAPSTPPGAAPVRPADGPRKITVEAGEKGYVPDRIPGKPGEKLVLVFTRTVDGDCLAKVKTPDGKLVDLPKGAPVEVAVTVPQTGELTFACGMEMFKGVIVADPSS